MTLKTKKEEGVAETNSRSMKVYARTGLGVGSSEESLRKDRAGELRAVEDVFL